jgi:hypothetical protein
MILYYNRFDRTKVMALLFIIIGIAIVISGIRNTYAQLGQQLAADFTGSGSFIYWVAAIMILGMVGYIPGAQKPARMLLALVILSFVLANGTGFFDRLKSALTGAQPAAAPPDTAPTTGIPVTPTSSGQSSSGGGGPLAFLGGLLGGGGGSSSNAAAGAAVQGAQVALQILPALIP